MAPAARRGRAGAAGRGSGLGAAGPRQAGPLAAAPSPEADRGALPGRSPVAARLSGAPRNERGFAPWRDRPRQTRARLNVWRTLAHAAAAAAVPAQAGAGMPEGERSAAHAEEFWDVPDAARGPRWFPYLPITVRVVLKPGVYEVAGSSYIICVCFKVGGRGKDLPEFSR